MSLKNQLAYLTLKIAYLVGKICEKILARLQRSSVSDAASCAACYFHRFLDKQLKPLGLPLGKVCFVLLENVIKNTKHPVFLREMNID